VLVGGPRRQLTPLLLRTTTPLTVADEGLAHPNHKHHQRCCLLTIRVSQSSGRNPSLSRKRPSPRRHLRPIYSSTPKAGYNHTTYTASRYTCYISIYVLAVARDDKKTPLTTATSSASNAPGAEHRHRPLTGRKSLYLQRWKDRQLSI
jgi:hypothetical protein